LLIVDSEALFKLCQLCSECLVSAKQFPKPGEGTDNVDAHFDGSGAIQDIGCLDGSVLGKGKRLVTAASISGT